MFKKLRFQAVSVVYFRKFLSSKEHSVKVCGGGVGINFRDFHGFGKPRYLVPYQNGILNSL